MTTERPYDHIEVLKSLGTKALLNKAQEVCRGTVGEKQSKCVLVHKALAEMVAREEAKRARKAAKP
jgi:hypothetical protein